MFVFSENLNVLYFPVTSVLRFVQFLYYLQFGTLFDIYDGAFVEKLVS